MTDGPHPRHRAPGPRTPHRGTATATAAAVLLLTAVGCAGVVSTAGTQGTAPGPAGTAGAQRGAIGPGGKPAPTSTAALRGTPTGAVEPSIRDVDFANFTLPPDVCGGLASDPPEHGYELHDGEARSGDPSQPGFVGVSLGDIAYGDLTGDASDEAVLIVFCTPGNHPFPHGWVYTMDDGAPARLAAIELDQYDLPRVGVIGAELLEVSIEGGTVRGTWALYLDNDAMCCPSKRATAELRWNGSALEQQGRPRIEKVTP